MSKGIGLRVLKDSTIKIKRRSTNTVRGKIMTKNFEAYYKLDTTGLENKYVILVDGEVVAKGEDIETMLEEVRQKYPDEIPFVAKVPDKKMLIF